MRRDVRMDRQEFGNLERDGITLLGLVYSIGFFGWAAIFAAAALLVWIVVRS